MSNPPLEAVKRCDWYQDGQRCELPLGHRNGSASEQQCLFRDSGALTERPIRIPGGLPQIARLVGLSKPVHDSAVDPSPLAPREPGFPSDEVIVIPVQAGDAFPAFLKSLNDLLASSIDPRLVEELVRRVACSGSKGLPIAPAPFVPDLFPAALVAAHVPFAEPGDKATLAALSAAVEVGERAFAKVAELAALVEPPSPADPQPVTCTQSADSNTLFPESPPPMAVPAEIRNRFIPFCPHLDDHQRFEPHRDSKAHAHHLNVFQSDAPNPQGDARRYARALNSIAHALVAGDVPYIAKILESVLGDPADRLPVPTPCLQLDSAEYRRIRDEVAHYAAVSNSPADVADRLLHTYGLACDPNTGNVSPHFVGLLKSLAKGSLLLSIDLSDPREWLPMNARAERWFTSYEALLARGADPPGARDEADHGLPDPDVMPSAENTPIFWLQGHRIDERAPWLRYGEFPSDFPFFEARRARRVKLVGLPGRPDSLVIDAHLPVSLVVHDLAPVVATDAPNVARIRAYDQAAYFVGPAFETYDPPQDRTTRVELAFLTLPDEPARVRTIYRGGTSERLASRLVGLDWLVPPVVVATINGPVNP